MGLSYAKEIVSISSAVWAQCTNVTDRQTERQREGNIDRVIEIACNVYWHVTAPYVVLLSLLLFYYYPFSAYIRPIFTVEERYAISWREWFTHRMEREKGHQICCVCCFLIVAGVHCVLTWYTVSGCPIFLHAAAIENHRHALLPIQTSHIDFKWAVLEMGNLLIAYAAENCVQNLHATYSLLKIFTAILLPPPLFALYTVYGIVIVTYIT